MRGIVGITGFSYAFKLTAFSVTVQEIILTDVAYFPVIYHHKSYRNPQ